MTSSALRVGILLCDGFQELEFWYPTLRFRENQALVQIIGAKEDRTYTSALQYPVNPDIPLSSARPEDYDVVFIPGTTTAAGAAHSDSLAGAAKFAAAAHAAGAILGLTSSAIALLSTPGLPAGVKAASATGERVVVDGRIVTACDADDLPRFFPALNAAAAQA